MGDKLPTINLHTLITCRLNCPGLHRLTLHQIPQPNIQNVSGRWWVWLSILTRSAIIPKKISKERDEHFSSLPKLRITHRMETKVWSYYCRSVPLCTIVWKRSLGHNMPKVPQKFRPRARTQFWCPHKSFSYLATFRGLSLLNCRVGGREEGKETLEKLAWQVTTTTTSSFYVLNN